MDWEAVTPLIVLVTVVLTTGWVLLLRPVVCRVADCIVLRSERRPCGLDREVRRLTSLLAAMDARLDRLEAQRSRGLSQPDSTRQPDGRAIGARR